MSNCWSSKVAEVSRSGYRYHVKDPLAKLPSYRLRAPRSRGSKSCSCRIAGQHGRRILLSSCSTTFVQLPKKSWCLNGTTGRHGRARTQTRASLAATQPTLTTLFASLLGYCVVAGSFTRSVPQIVRILKNRSVEGISLAAQYAELVAYSITVAYNLDHGYAFSTYGDTAACWVQDVILILLIARYRGGLWKQTVLSAIIVAAVCWALLSGAVSRPALAVLQASTILIISLGGRIPQIMLNFRRGNSGELSPVTSGLNLAGNLARTFTTLILTQDLINLAGTLVQAVLNGILVWQSVSTAKQAQGAEPEDFSIAEAKAA